MNLKDMSKKERSLLLYLESRAVDNGGVVCMLRMNAEEITIAEEWKASGFLREWRRIPYHAITQQGESQLVELDPHAFELAHEERLERAKRLREDSYISKKWKAEYQA